VRIQHQSDIYVTALRQLCRADKYLVFGKPRLQAVITFDHTKWCNQLNIDEALDFVSIHLHNHS